MPAPLALPNPPARFVGRTREIRWLRAAVGRAPVTVIAGEAGLGKSALALFVLHTRFPERARGALWVSLRDLDPHEPVALGLLRTLVRAGNLRRFDWAELLAAPEAQIAAAVALSESLSSWILLDDAHHADPAQVGALLGHAARYGRDSRLLVTTRRAPDGDALLGQTLELGAMNDRDLMRLGRALDPGARPQAIREAVAGAAGSPWRLRQAQLGAPPEAPAAPDLDELLARSGDAAAEIAALRLLLVSGARDAAAALLDQAATRLFETGYAPALWRLLESEVDARFTRARLRCAVELGDAAALARVGPPGGADPESHLSWARVLFARGRLAETVQAAEEARAVASAGSRADIAFQAGFLAVQATAGQADLPAALARLDVLSPGTPAEAAQRDAYRAFVLASLRRTDEALAAAGAAAQGLAAITWPARAHTGVLLARTLYRLARLREAASILDAAIAEGPQGSPRFDLGRDLRFTRAALALDAGDLDRARAELDALEPYLGPRSLFFPYARHARVILALAAGDLDGIDERVAAAAEGAPAALQREAELDRARLALLRREPLREPEAGPIASIFGDAYRLIRVELAVRAGEITPAAALAELDPRIDQAELRSLARRGRAVAHLIAGDLDEALAEIDEAIAVVRDHGFRVHEAEAREVACDVLLLRGGGPRLASAVDALAALGESMPSPRFACAARFFRAVTDPAALEAIAGAWHVAPLHALRARALLGAPAPRDAVDRLVLAAITSRPGYRAPEPLGAPALDPWQPGWGIDEGATAVWLPSGERLDLSRQGVAWKILVTLAACGGRASKEELVAEVWSERDYHPLRHDNRLQVAVRALRALVEADPKRPTRVLTTEDGYALGGGARVLRAAQRR